jgi:hypothetical protein
MDLLESCMINKKQRKKLWYIIVKEVQVNKEA